MPKIGFLRARRVNRLELCFVSICVVLFVCLIYSLFPGLFPYHYPSSTGETWVKLDRAYYQIWGDSIQIHAALSELYTDESPEPFEGHYTVLLLDTNESPVTSIYNKTRTLGFRWKINNESLILYNSSVSVITTPIKHVVTKGDTINFDINITVEEDLLLKFYPLPRDLRDFQLKKGLNTLSVEITFVEGDEPHQVLMHYRLISSGEELNSTIRRAFGRHSLFDIRFYKNTTTEVKRAYDGWIESTTYVLPFSARVLDERSVYVENGTLFCAFPLNASLSANKIVFVQSADWDSYVIDVNPLTILFSPPITLPPMILLILSYVVYIKWQGLLSHLLRYKFFYTSISVAILLLAFQSLQGLSAPIYATFLFLTLCLTCIGFISIGVIKNNFTRDEYRSFWRKIILLMTLLPLFHLTSFVYYTLSSGDFELFIFYVPAIPALLLLFLGSCLVGMIVNSLISYTAGFCLLVGHLVLRVWCRIQHVPEIPTFMLSVPVESKRTRTRSFYYYLSEFFMFSLWFVILISSSIPVSVKDLWMTMWERNLLFLLIPLSAIVDLLLLYELLNVLSRKGREKRTVSPQRIRKFVWSTFAVIVFVVKIFWEGLSLSFLRDLAFMSYFLLLISAGFAIGFVGTRRIGLKHASEEIIRLARRYRGITIHGSNV